jgi:hypothetical protein
MKIANRTDCGDLNFELRPDQGVWLWWLASLCHHAGIIGAAATESEAVREARATIDGLSARCRVAAPRCGLREPAD